MPGDVHDIFKMARRTLHQRYLNEFPVLVWPTREIVHRRKKRTLTAEAMEEVKEGVSLSSSLAPAEPPRTNCSALSVGKNHQHLGYGSRITKPRRCVGRAVVVPRSRSSKKTTEILFGPVIFWISLSARAPVQKKTILIPQSNIVEFSLAAGSYP